MSTSSPSSPGSSEGKPKLARKPSQDSPAAPEDLTQPESSEPGRADKELKCSPEEERTIVGQLQTQDESLHVYCVSKTWYETWKRYVGLVPSEDPPRPAAIYMDCEDDDNNMLVDEKVWKMWVLWYSVSDSHELDRRNWASDEKEFEICQLSPYCSLLDNPLKDFDITEETGYVELQMRRIFRVAETRKTRLWVREKSRTKFGRFQLLLDRREELCYQNIIDHDHEYVIAIEVANPDGTWPSAYPGEPIGDFSKFADLTRLKTADDFWQEELRVTLESVFQGIKSELEETTKGVVCAASILTQNKEQQLEERCKTVKADEGRLSKVQEDLKQREALIKDEEKRMEDLQANIQQQQGKLSKERERLDQEIEHMSQVNSMAKSLVKLDVGGISYTTSVVTLTRDPDSMLAAMFSGRHELKKEADGSIFMDRDGTHFRFILNFLRDGGFKAGTLPEDQAFLTELLTEAEYYQISGLVAFLATTLATMDPDHSSMPGERVSRRLSRKIATKK